MVCLRWLLRSASLLAGDWLPLMLIDRGEYGRAGGACLFSVYTLLCASAGNSIF